MPADARPGSAANPAAGKTPFALVIDGAAGPVLQAANEAAAACGLHAGMSLAAARALCPRLVTAAARPQRDAAWLRRLARWCRRYAPSVSVAPPAGIGIEITGAVHLFGGERALVQDLLARLAGHGIPARAAVADTADAAHLLARHATTAGRPSRIVAAGETAAALAALPAAVLAPTSEDAQVLENLGLRTVGDLLAQPRAALARRFPPPAGGAGRGLLARLDRALGRAPDPQIPLAATRRLRVTRWFAEPLSAVPEPAALLAPLMAALCEKLAAAGRGARRIEACFHLVDGRCVRWQAATAAPSRCSRHLTGLLALKAVAFDPGFGVEAVTLCALQTAPLPAADRDFTGHQQQRESLMALCDRLAARLGADHLGVIAPVASHVPERAERRCSLPAKPASWRQAAPPPGPARPLRLLARPEEIAVTALLPEGPPRQFRWRRRLYRIARAEGPERIAPEWWRPGGQTAGLRDYYRIEDDGGRRFWIFRAGCFRSPAAAPPRWFLHGFFP